MAKQQDSTKAKKNPDELMRENKALKAELAKLKSQTSSNQKSGLNWKAFLKWGSISLAGAIFVVASIVFYIGMTLTNTDRFMDVAEPLAKQPAVQEAVAVKTTDALFERIDVESLSTEVLPDKVDFLAPTVATQIQQFTKSEVQKIIASDSFQETWNTLVRRAHERLITNLENYEGDGTIDLNDIYSNLAQRLDGGKLSFLSNRDLPPRIGNITIIQSDWLPVAHNVVSNFQTVRAVTIGLFLLLLAFAVWVSKNRRRTIMQLASMIVALSFILLLSLRVARKIFLDQVDPTYLQAATEIWTVFTRPFAIQLVTTIVIALAILVVAWLGGQSKSAVGVRSRIESLFAGKLHETIFREENAVTKWVSAKEKVLLGILGIGFVLSLLLIDLTLGSLIVAALVASAIGIVIVILSGKKS